MNSVRKKIILSKKRVSYLKKGAWEFCKMYTKLKHLGPLDHVELTGFMGMKVTLKMNCDCLTVLSSKGKAICFLDVARADFIPIYS